MAPPPLSAGASGSAFTNQIGLWAHVTERLTGHLHEIKAAGFDYLILKDADGHGQYHPDALKQVVSAIADAKLDLPVKIWSYVKPDDPAGNAAAILKGLPAGVKDVVLDAEIEWEEAPAKYGAAVAVTRVHSLCKPLTAAGVTLHLSSFWSPKLHSSLPFRAFLLHCATWQPQMYVEPGSRTAAVIADHAISEGRQICGEQKRSMIPTVNDTSFLPLIKAAGFTGFNVYAWDPEGDAQVSKHLPAWAAAIKQFEPS